MTKFRKNNSGFSLVEVLVSLGIIGIIVVPLIGNFIASQNVNRTLRMRQAATALAQSTMETMKNMNMKDTAANFNVNDSFSLGGYSHGDVLELGHNGLNYVKLSNSYAGVVKDDSVGTVYNDTTTGKRVYNPKSTGKYAYAIHDIVDGVNKFDVLVEFESDMYKKYTDSSGNEVDGYNSQSLSSIAGLDSNRSALITTTEGIENDAALYFEALIGDPAVSASHIKQYMYAETVITVSGTDDPSAKDKDRKMAVEAKITYSYDSYSKEEVIFAHTYGVEDEKHLENMYVLFTESSGSKKTNNKKQCDTFKINVNGNFTTISPKVYIIKQGSTDVDCYYNIMLNKKAKNMFKEFYSNVQKKFVNNYVAISKLANFDIDNYYETTDFFSNSSGVVASDEENRIYEMTVYVYESNPSNRYSNLITSITSTIREK